MNNNPFATYYATLDNAALLAVVRTPDDYQPAAVEAAQRELERRGLSGEQMENAAADLEQSGQKSLATPWNRLVQAAENTTGRAAAYVADNIAAEDTEKDESVWRRVAHYTAGVRGVRIMALIYAISLLTLLLEAGEMMVGIIQYNLFDLASAWYFLSYGILLSVPFLLWRCRKAGWIIAVGAASYGMVATVILFMQAVTQPQTPLLPGISETLQHGSLSSFVSLLLSAAFTAFAFRRSIRAAVHVSNNTALYTPVAGAAVALLLMCIL